MDSGASDFGSGAAFLMRTVSRSGRLGKGKLPGGRWFGTPTITRDRRLEIALRQVAHPCMDVVVRHSDGRPTQETKAEIPQGLNQRLPEGFREELANYSR